MRYSILSASDAADFTKRNRANPVESILSCIEARIVEVINYRMDAITWLFEGEDIPFMDEVIKELRNCGYVVKEANDYEDASTFSVRISWVQ